MAWAALAASLAMLAFMARSLVTGQIPFTGDLLHFHYPLRDFYARQLGAGEPFDWMPGLFAGFYVVGEGQLGGYHPLHWLLYRALPLDRAFAVELVLAYPLLFAGTWLWLRRRCGAGPAAFGAMTATFCGFTLVHGVHPNMVGVLAHVPWLLWVLDGVAARHVPGNAWRPDLRGTGLIGLLIGSQLLLGHPQSVWFSGLVCAAYTAHLITAARPRRWIVGRTLAASVVLGVLVGAVQVLATVNAVAQSNRPAFDVDFATQYSLRPLHLLHLLHPYLFWGRWARWNETAEASDEFGVYGGGVALLLAVWWMARVVVVRANLRAARYGGQADRLSLHVAAFGVAGLWLATGSHGGLYYLQTWLPLVSQFRAPVRYLLFAHWALAVLATFAVAYLARPAEGDATRERTALGAAWGVVVVAAASAWWLATSGVLPGASEFAAVTWIGPLVLSAAAALLTLAARGVRVALVGLVLLAAGDQTLYGLNGVIGWQDFIARQEVPGYLDTKSFLPRAGETRLMRGNFPNLYLLAGHRLLDGYVAITPARQLEYHQPNALRVAQVEYAHEDFFVGTPVPPGRDTRERGWHRLPGALARVRLVADARVSTSPATDIAQVDVALTALVTRDVRLGGGSAGTARLVTDNPGDITVEVNAPASQLLVVSESYHDGWRATIDGGRVDVERVNGDFLGVVVPAGTHVARFHFRPSHLLVGRFVSVSGLVVGLLLLWMGRKDCRPETGEPSAMTWLTIGKWLALDGALILIAGPLGTRLGVWSFMVGFGLLALGALSILLSVLALLVGGFRTGEWLRALPLIAGGLVVVAVPVFLVVRAGGAPPIHDITTDTADPPRFVSALPLRTAAGAANPPEYVGAKVAAQQLSAFPDIQPLDLPLPPQQAFDRALAQVRELGWEVSGSAPTEGRIEAVDTTFFFGFKDDVVIRLRPTEGGTRVDARSKSRIGVGDLGTNAARIRRLLAALRSGA